eukprot:scaffold289058_cov31-Tisochrysis_lutea.AAC.1
MRRSPVFALSLGSLALAALAYDQGEDITLCWSRAGGYGPPIREDCRGSLVYYIEPPAAIAEFSAHPIIYELAVPTLLMPNRSVPHLNLHVCNRMVGFCTPFISETPGLVTQSPALTGELKLGSIPDSEANSSYNYLVARASSELSLSMDDYTIIAHAWWVDIEGNRHDLSRATLLDVYQEITLGAILAIAFGCLLVVVCAGIISGIVACCFRRYRRALAHADTLERKARRDFETRKRRVRNACLKSNELAFPLCALTFDNFKAHGTLWKHEDARASGKLIVYDTTDEMAHAVKEGAHLPIATASVS